MLPGYARWGFTFFFVTHIIITLLLDVQALPIGDNFPEVLKSLMRVCTAVGICHSRTSKRLLWTCSRAFLGFRSCTNATFPIPSKRSIFPKRRRVL